MFRSVRMQQERVWPGVPSFRQAHGNGSATRAQGRQPSGWWWGRGRRRRSPTFGAIAGAENVDTVPAYEKTPTFARRAGACMHGPEPRYGLFSRRHHQAGYGQVFWLPGRSPAAPSHRNSALRKWHSAAFVAGYSGASAADLHGLPLWAPSQYGAPVTTRILLPHPRRVKMLAARMPKRPGIDGGGRVVRAAGAVTPPRVSALRRRPPGRRRRHPRCAAACRRRTGRLCPCRRRGRCRPPRPRRARSPRNP